MPKTDLTLSTLFRAEISQYLKNVRTLKQQLRELSKLTGQINQASQRASSGITQLEKTVGSTNAAFDSGQKKASVYQRELGKLNQRSASLGESFRKLTNRGKLSDNVMMQMSNNLQKYHGNIQKVSASFGSYLNAMRKTQTGTRAATAALSSFNTVTRKQTSLQKAAWGMLDNSQKGLTRYFASVGKGNELLRSFAGVTQKAATSQTRLSRQVQSLNKAYDQGQISLQQMVTRNSQLQASLGKVAKTTQQITAHRKASHGAVKQSAAYAKALNLQYDKGQISLQGMVKSMSKYQSTQTQTAKTDASYISTAKSKSRWMTSLNRMYDQGAISLQEMLRRQQQTTAAMNQSRGAIQSVTKAQSASIQTAKSKTKWMTSLNRMYDQGQVSLQQMVQRYNQTTAALGKATKATQGATGATRKNISTVQDSNKNLRAHGKQLAHIEGAWNRVKAAARVTASYGIAATAIYSVVGAARAGVTAIGEYDQSLKNLQAITGATVIQTEGMGQKMRDVARETKFSVSEIAEGMQLLGQAGFSAEESLDAISAVANLATGTLSTLKTTSDLLTSAIRAFALEAKEAGRVSDVMANSINQSKLTVDKLRIAFNFVGASASQAGLSLEETAASLQILANSGLRASTMGTGLRQILAKLLSPSRALREEFERHGVAVENIDLSNYQKTMEQLTQVLWDHEKQTVDMTKAYDLFKLRGAQAAAVLVRGFASGEFDQVLKNTYEVGSAAEMAAIQQEGLVVKMKNLADRAKNLAVALGDAGLVSVFGVFLDALRNTTAALETFAMSGLGSTAIQFIALSTALTGAVKGMRLLLAATKGTVALQAMNVFVTNLRIGLAGLATGSMAAAGAMKHLKWAFTGFFSSITIWVTLLTAVGMGLYHLATRHDRAAKAAAENALQHDKAVASLDSLAKIAERARLNQNEWISVLKRFQKESPELAKRMAELSQNTDITTMSYDQLVESMHKVRMEEMKASVASLVEQLSALEKKNKANVEYLKYLSGLYGDDFGPAADKAAKAQARMNANLDEQLGVMANIASQIADHARATNMSAQETDALVNSMVEAGEISEKVGKRIKNWVTKAMKEMAQQAKETKKAFSEMLDEAPEEYRKFYEDLSLLEQARYAEVVSNTDKEIAEYKRRAEAMGHTEAEIAAATKVIRAKNHADFLASLTKETDSFEDNERKKIEILQDRLQKELDQIDQRIKAEESAYQEALATYQGQANKLEQEKRAHEQRMAALEKERVNVSQEISNLILDIEANLYDKRVKAEKKFQEQLKNERLAMQKAAMDQELAEVDLMEAKKQLSEEEAANKRLQIQRDYYKARIQEHRDALKTLESDESKSAKEKEVIAAKHNLAIQQLETKLTQLKTKAINNQTDAAEEAAKQEVDAAKEAAKQKKEIRENELLALIEDHERQLEYIDTLENEGVISHHEAVQRKTAADEAFLNNKIEKLKGAVDDALNLYGKDSDAYRDAVNNMKDAQQELIELQKESEERQKEAQESYQSWTDWKIKKIKEQALGYDELNAKLKEQQNRLADIPRSTPYVVMLNQVNRVVQAMEDYVEQFDKVHEHAQRVLGVQIDISNTSFDDLVAGVEGLRQKFADTYEQTKETRGGIDDIKNGITQWRNEISDADAAMDAYTNSVQAYNQAWQNLFSDTPKTIAEIEAALDSVAGSYDDMVSAGAAAIDSLKSKWDELNDKIKGVEQTIRDLHKNTADTIRDLNRDLMNDEQAWLDTRQQAHEVYARAVQEMERGNVEYAKQLFDEARALAQSLATEIKDTEGNTIRSLESTTDVAISLLNKIMSAQESGLKSYMTGMEQQQNALDQTITKVWTRLDSTGRRLDVLKGKAIEFGREINSWDYGGGQDFRKYQFATGGPVRGPSHAAGGVPIEAEGGEYILPKNRVKELGLPFLEALRSGAGAMARMFRPKFAEGGLIDWDDVGKLRLGHWKADDFYLNSPNPKYQQYKFNRLFSPLMEDIKDVLQTPGLVTQEEADKALDLGEALKSFDMSDKAPKDLLELLRSLQQLFSEIQASHKEKKDDNPDNMEAFRIWSRGDDLITQQLLKKINEPVSTLSNIINAATTEARDERISSFATGGPVRGPSHAAGGVPIEAEGGEYIQPKDSVQKYGRGVFDLFRAKAIPVETVQNLMDSFRAKAGGFVTSKGMAIQKPTIVVPKYNLPKAASGGMVGTGVSGSVFSQSTRYAKIELSLGQKKATGFFPESDADKLLKALDLAKQQAM
jgi:TP901 family phage tail tape measure protein